MSSISEVKYRKASQSDISELVELRIKQLIAEGYPEVEAKALNFPLVKLHASSHGKGIYEKAGFVKADGYMSLQF